VAALPDGTLTLLFSDIEGSTGLLKRLGDGWPDALARQRAVLREAVAAHGGVVVDCQGDALFAVFRSAHEGVAAAEQAQRALAEEPWPEDVPLRARMALHTGEPRPSGDGYVGLDVVRAARLCAAGHGGQVLLSETARLLSGAAVKPLGEVRLRGVDAPERVYQLTLTGLQGSFPPLRTPALEKRSPAESQRSFDERMQRASEELGSRILERVAGRVEEKLRRL
jgi:class 3 adenylate cyclase